MKQGIMKFKYGYAQQRSNYMTILFLNKIFPGKTQGLGIMANMQKNIYLY